VHVKSTQIDVSPINLPVEQYHKIRHPTSKSRCTLRSGLTVVDKPNSRCDVCTPHTLRTSTVFEKAREAAGEIQPRPAPQQPANHACYASCSSVRIRHRRTYMLTATAYLCTEKLKTFATLASLARLTYRDELRAESLRTLQECLLSVVPPPSCPFVDGRTCL
jgi:hypothetical protein